MNHINIYIVLSNLYSFKMFILKRLKLFQGEENPKQKLIQEKKKLQLKGTGKMFKLRMHISSPYHFSCRIDHVHIYTV